MTTDFVLGLPWTLQSNDCIWVNIDRLSKLVHFLPVILAMDPLKLAKIYVDEIIRLHSAPVSIMSNRDVKFTSRFWEGLQWEMGIALHSSTAFHQRTNSQSE